MISITDVRAAVAEAEKGVLPIPFDIPKEWLARLDQIGRQKWQLPDHEEPAPRAFYLAGRVLAGLAMRNADRPGINTLPAGGLILQWIGTSTEVHISNGDKITVHHLDDGLIDLDQVRAAINDVEEANDPDDDTPLGADLPQEWMDQLKVISFEESPAAENTAMQPYIFTQLLLQTLVAREVRMPAMSLLESGGVQLSWPGATISIYNSGDMHLIADDTNIPGQPDGCEDGSTDMPKPARAATRVLGYVGEFGDGLYDSINGRPLYGRDLEALAKTTNSVQGLLDDLTRAFPDPTQFSVEATLIDRLALLLKARS